MPNGKFAGEAYRQYRTGKRLSMLCKQDIGVPPAPGEKVKGIVIHLHQTEVTQSYAREILAGAGLNWDGNG